MESDNTSDFNDLLSPVPDVNIPGTLTVKKDIRYVDMSKIRFLNNSVMVLLINRAKVYLSKGIDVVFVNVPDFLKRAIKKLGLDDIINCK